jgi:RNA polymerase sigma-70 factor, ECF subfamily
VAIDRKEGREYLKVMATRAEKLLLDRLQEGDEAAFAELVAGHSARLLALAWRLTGDRADAEDIAQEAFLRLHRHLGDFRGDSSLATWLHRTVSRLAIDHLRRRKLKERIFFFRRSEEETDPMELVADPGPSPGQNYQVGEIRQRVERGLQRLSARQRVVFTLRHHEEMPLREIAALLELEEGTVKSHLHRAVHQLREELKDLRENSP